MKRRIEDYDYWAKMPAWTVQEAAALLGDMEPFYFFQEPDDEDLTILGWLQRAHEVGQISDPASPLYFLKWAQEHKVEYPAILGDKVEAFWGQFTNIDALLKEIDNLKAEIVTLQKTDKNPNTKRHNSALKLIAGLAIAIYKHDFKKFRTTTVSEIVSDLKLEGISMDEDTIRSLIKDGENQLDDLTKTDL